MITVLRVAVPISVRGVEFFLKKLEGTRDEKNAVIHHAEKCAVKYQGSLDIADVKKLPPIQYHTYRVEDIDFSGMFRTEQDRLENDKFFKLVDTDA